jgi:hypothetical protein
MRAIIITVVVAFLLGGGGTYLWLYHGGFSAEQGMAVAFIDTYGDYAEVADRVDLLVHLPGAAGNTDRAELRQLLENILTEQLEPARRDALARLAFKNLDTINKEIDAAQAAQAELYERLQELDNAARVFRAMQLRSKAEEVVTYARKRAELSARVTAVLAETHEQTYAIITRVLEEEGVLSDAHIIDINDSTSTAEARHDTLSGLYVELSEQRERLEKAFGEFAAMAI